MFHGRKFLGDVFFFIYFFINVNDKRDCLSSYINLFANHTKIMKHIVWVDCCKELQKN